MDGALGQGWIRRFRSSPCSRKKTTSCGSTRRRRWCWWRRLTRPGTARASGRSWCCHRRAWVTDGYVERLRPKINPAHSKVSEDVGVTKDMMTWTSICSPCRNRWRDDGNVGSRTSSSAQGPLGHGKMSSTCASSWGGDRDRGEARGGQNSSESSSTNCGGAAKAAEIRAAWGHDLEGKERAKREVI